MLAARSRTIAVLSVAASSPLRGDTNRVFVLPGIEGLAMTAIAQVERNAHCSPSPVHASTSLARHRIVTHFPRTTVVTVGVGGACCTTPEDVVPGTARNAPGSDPGQRSDGRT